MFGLGVFVDRREWARIAPLLPSRAGTKGCRWRALPAAWGNWYTRFQHWTATGVWAQVLAAVQQDDARHMLLVDSTTVRAH